MSVLFFLKRFLNWILVSCLITPATVSYWRGTWYILDFVFPDNQVSSAWPWITLAASSGIIFLIMLVADHLKAILNQRKARKVLYLVMFYPLSIMIVTFWRGVWMLLDYYTTTSQASFCVSHIVGFLIVLSTKTTSSIVAAPGYCISERYAEPTAIVLEGKNYFRKSTSNFCEDIAARMLNSFINVFVIGSAVVSYWRGTWNIVKYIKHPNDNAISSVLAMSVGYAVASICYCLSVQIIATEKLNPPYPWWQRTLEQIFVYILGFGVILTWVGLWSFEDIFLLPDRPIASALVCHFAGIAILYLLQGSLNLIGSPACFRIHPDNTLEGLDMGSYLNRELEKGTAQKHNKSEVSTATDIAEAANKELDATRH